LIEMPARLWPKLLPERTYDGRPGEPVAGRFPGWTLDPGAIRVSGERTGDDGRTALVGSGEFPMYGRTVPGRLALDTGSRLVGR